MAAEEGCPSTYSEDEFELSLSASSVYGVGDDRGPDTSGSHEEEEKRQPQHRENHERNVVRRDAQRKDAGFEPAVLSNENFDPDGSEGGYSYFRAPSESLEEETSLPAVSPSSTAQKRDGRSTKQKYLDLKKKAAAVREEADAFAQWRYAEDLQLALQAKTTKEAWHERIHRRHTELEWHRRLSQKTAQSVIDTALNREAWTKGVLRARARETAIEAAFSSTFGSLQDRISQQKAAAVAAERERAKLRAAACTTMWDAARYGVPVWKLREMIDQEIRKSRNHDPSEPFEQLCRRVEGSVVESKHPYPKGVRQDIKVNVPNAASFYVAFDAASNATMGMGKVALQGSKARDPNAFFPRGAYEKDTAGEARLPGVDGEPPMRVEGSSVLVTFSASYWAGVAPAGDDYGWRLVCFTADSSDHANALVAEAQRAAARAEAVDAINITGETCLHIASFQGNVPAARYLLSVDADPNSSHSASGHNTPLHQAARGGSLAVTRLLLKSSANVLATNSHGDHPLHVACREGRLGIARRILAHDFDLITVAARNHAGLRPADVVPGCSALVALLSEVEISAATIAAKAETTYAAKNVRAAATPPEFRTRSSFGNKGGAWVSGSAGDIGRVGDGRGGGGGSAPFLRRGGRRGGRRKKAGWWRSSWDGVVSKALLADSHLPRSTRLPRPVDGEPPRQRGSLDGRDRRQRLQESDAEAGGVEGVRNSVKSVVSDGGSDAQSVAGWSGTSYGASLTESDFAIPCGVGGHTIK